MNVIATGEQNAKVRISYDENFQCYKNVARTENRTPELLCSEDVHWYFNSLTLNYSTTEFSRNAKECITIVDKLVYIITFF